VIGPFAAETVLVDGYAASLLTAAAGLDRLARHIATRSERLRTGGFTYRPEHDAWICPTDQLLWPQYLDRDNELVRYRAKPVVCNACPRKSDCTSDDGGREIVRPLRPWPHSEAGRFHRGLALVLVVLAALLATVEAVRRHTPSELVLAGATAAAAAAVGWWLTAHFRATPTGFPEPHLPSAPPSAPASAPSRYATLRGRGSASDDRSSL
jgi:hypothetical protein